MKDLEYYLDLNNCVFCYDKDVEFFVLFIKKEKKWIKSNISFTQFCHDYEFKEISFKQALTLCDNILPDDAYYEYLEMLERNGGIVKQRDIKIFRESNEKSKDIAICLYVDGVKYKYIEDNKTISFKLNFKDHIISCRIAPTHNIKTYELHVPYGVDAYSFTLQFKNDEFILI